MRPATLGSSVPETPVMQASAELIPHTATPSAAVRRIAVTLTWPGDRSGFRLGYVLEGDVQQLRIPPAGEPRRADGLWRATCCELFLRSPGAAGYREFNFAPSGAWAAWQFTGRREGMRELELTAAPRIESSEQPGRWQLDMALPLAAEKPDFHDPASHTLRLERT